jgi:hypothetical protein
MAMADPTVRTLTTTLASSPGVIVRPFADRHGAVIVGPTGVVFVEVEPGRGTDRSADWLFRLDRALSGPSFAAVVQSDYDVQELAATVRSRRLVDLELRRSRG